MSKAATTRGASKKFQPPKKFQTPKSVKASRGLPVFPIVLGVIVVLGVIAVAIAAASREAVPEETRPVALEGDDLVRYDEGALDPAVGEVAPVVTGENADGEPVEIAPDGRPKAIAFLAHWCPACDAEVPEIAEFLAEEGLPDGVDLYVVPTAISQARPNHPPSRWLRAGGLGNVPALHDDGGSPVAAAFGLPSYPYWVFLDGDHVVQGRVAGRFGAEAYPEIFAALAEGRPITVDGGAATDATTGELQE